MAGTPHGSWAGCRHFGVRDLFEQTAQHPEKLRLAVAEINRALDDLGVTSFQVEAITCESSIPSEIRWVVNLASKVDRTKTFSFEWNGRTG